MSNVSGSDGCAASEPLGDNMALWMEATGEIKKGKIFGMESLSRMYMPHHAGTSSSNVTGRRRARQNQQLTKEVDNLRNILVQKDEQINFLQQQMEIVMRHQPQSLWGSSCTSRQSNR